MEAEKLPFCEPGVSFDKSNNSYKVTIRLDGRNINVTTFPANLLDMANECARDMQQVRTIDEFEDIRLKWIQKKLDMGIRKGPRKRVGQSAGGVVEMPSRPLVADGAGQPETFKAVQAKPDIRFVPTGRQVVLERLNDLLDKQERFEAASKEVVAARAAFMEALPPGIRRLMSVEDIAAALIAEQRGGGDGE